VPALDGPQLQRTDSCRGCSTSDERHSVLPTCPRPADMCFDFRVGKQATGVQLLSLDDCSRQADA